MQELVLCLAVLLILLSSQKAVVLVAFYRGLRKPKSAALSGFCLS